MKQKRTARQIMRALHRDVGFLIAGLTLVYALSGIVLVYRDTDFLKSEKRIEKTLDPNLEAEEIGRALRIRNFKVTETVGDILHFQQGTYDKSSGETVYFKKELPFIVGIFTKLHKSPSSNIIHWFGVLYGILLLFLAVSSFWMFKKGTGNFKRGMYISLGGLAITILLLIFI